MDLKDIKELIRMVDKSNLTELEIEDETSKIRIAKKIEMVQAPQMSYMPMNMPMMNQAPQTASPSSGSATEAVVDNKNYTEIKSPMVGTYYASPSPDAAPFVKEGDTISEGKTLCILEAMKLMNEIKAEVAGKIAKVLVKSGDPVEYNQVLFLIEK